MALTLKSWSLAAYTAGAWTDFVVGDAGGSTVRSVSLANTTVGDISVSMRKVSSAGAALAIIVPPVDLAAGAAYALDVPAINLVSGQKVQVSCAATGVEFSADGVSY